MPRDNARPWNGKRLPEWLLGTLPGTKLLLVARLGALGLRRLGTLPGTLLCRLTASPRPPGSLPGTGGLCGTLPGTVLRCKAAFARSVLLHCSSQLIRKRMLGTCNGVATLFSLSRNGPTTSGLCRASCACTI